MRLVDKKTKKFLRFYHYCAERKLVIRKTQYFVGDVNEAAERIAIMYEADVFFRWYEPLEQQTKGKHW